MPRDLGCSKTLLDHAAICGNCDTKIPAGAYGVRILSLGHSYPATGYRCTSCARRFLDQMDPAKNPAWIETLVQQVLRLRGATTLPAGMGDFIDTRVIRWERDLRSAADFIDNAHTTRDAHLQVLEPAAA